MTIARLDFLLEIGVEEVPARMVRESAENLAKLLAGELASARLEAASVKSLATPRRLVVLAGGVPERQEDRVTEKRGPARSAAFDAQGVPTKAGIGFARSQGLDVTELITIEHNGIEYVGARKQEKGEAALALLPGMLERSITTLRFPKSMRWGAQKQAFVRPVHWILAMLDGRVVDFEYSGVKASNCTMGHRFMGKRGMLDVNDPADYARVLRENFVMLDPEERKNEIRSAARRFEQDLGIELIEDDELLDTVAHLVELPVPAVGMYDEKYLQMPSEVLVTSMKNHQKFFAFRKDGKLANRFLVVNNTRPLDMSVVLRGNQRVLRARLEDALFFFGEDRKKPLSAFVEKLADQTFLAGLGSMKEKSRRLATLSMRYAGELFPEAAASAAAAAALCKADLATQMVGEFPELQGVMGREYALASGESPEVAVAVFEHYLPRFSGDALPASWPGLCLALADRMDTLAGCFHLKLVPTPTKDPYGLRRASLAAVRILAEKRIPVPLSRLVQLSIENYGSMVPDVAALADTILDFVRGRMRNWLAGDFAVEVVDACMEAGADFPFDVREKCAAVTSLRGRPDYASLITSFKRVINITRGESVEGKFDPGMPLEPSEEALFRAYEGIGPRLQTLLQSRQFPEVLALLVDLRPIVDRFFDDVLVMCDDLAVRRNRLALLSTIGRSFLEFADFTRILA